MHTRRTKHDDMPLSVGPLPRPLFLDTCALADTATIAAYRLGILRHGVVLQSVSREIAALCTDTAKHEVGQQAARAVIELHSLRHTTVTLDTKAPLDAHADEDLLQRAAAVQGGILTADHELQEKAHQRGVAVIAVQTLRQRLQPLAQELLRLFPHSQPIIPGARLRVRIVKCGNQGAGVGYLESGHTVVVAEGENFVGQDVEVCVERTRCNTVGKNIIFATCSAATPKLTVARNGIYHSPEMDDAARLRQ